MTDIDDFINYKKERGVKDGTLKHYRYTIGSVIRESNKDPRQMTEKDFRQAIDRLHLTSNSINTTVAIVKMFLRFIGNPLDIKFLTNHESPNAKWISEDNFLNAFRNCDDPTNKIILHLGGNYGFRRMEICNLKITDIDNGFFKVCGKGHGTGKHRDVPIMDNDPILKEYLVWRYKILETASMDRSDGRLVVSFHRRVVSGFQPHSLYERIKKFFKEQGIDATPHSLRREFVTSSYHAGIDLVTIQRLVGHSSPTTTEKYIENDKDMVIQAINRRSFYISNKSMT